MSMSMFQDAIFSFSPISHRMKSHSRLMRPASLLCLIVAVVSMAACSARVSTDPIADMTNREMSLNWRLDAAEQAKREMPNDTRRWVALDRIAWGEGQPNELRIHAIDELIGQDERDFCEKLDRRIVLIPYGPPLDHIYRVGKDRGWPELTPMLVKRWAVPQYGIPEEERTERRWISELNPGRAVEDVVFDLFIASPDKITDVQRVGAWSLLSRIATKEKLIAALDVAPQTTALVTDLKAAASDLHTLPRHREGVKWLFYLRDAARANLWQSAKANVARLSPQQRVGIEMRHLAILPHLDSTIWNVDRDALYGMVRSENDAQRHHITTPGDRTMSGDHPQRLFEWREQLTWGDLATLGTLWRVVQDPSVKAALFEQADRDLRDTSAEHGGVIDVVDGRPVAKAYPPISRLSHDRQFTPSDAMITHCYTGLAHYHFHAQEKNNRDYAGPGKGDLDTADRLDFNFLVFTFIDENQLNVDFYRHGRVVVDLGTIRR